MSDEELALVRDSGAAIAHCPTSNSLLGSGIMPLERVKRSGMDYALCTDVGASPTTSLLCEMVQFLSVHSGRTGHANATEALFRTTLAPARMLGLDRRYGHFAPGKSLSFIEIDSGETIDAADLEPDPEAVIQRHVLGLSALPAPPPAMPQLFKGNLTAPTELAALHTGVRIAMERLKQKIRAVVVEGQCQFMRSP